jgi:carboxymethylenebutenolidase
MVQDLMVAVERVVDTFDRAVRLDGDLGAALALMADDGMLVNLPAGTGGTGHEALARYLEEDVFGCLPGDLAFRRISRTVDRWHVAQESSVSFTHDRELRWLLPGRPATHRRVEVLAMSVVTVTRSRITSHRTLWDYSSLLAQIDQ